MDGRVTKLPGAILDVATRRPIGLRTGKYAVKVGHIVLVLHLLSASRSHVVMAQASLSTFGLTFSMAKTISPGVKLDALAHRMLSAFIMSTPPVSGQARSLGSGTGKCLIKVGQRFGLPLMCDGSINWHRMRNLLSSGYKIILIDYSSLRADGLKCPFSRN